MAQRLPPPPAALRIRSARRADLPALQRLNAQLQDYERALRPSRRTGKSLPLSYLTQRLQLQRRGSGRIWVATLNHQLVAFATAVLEHDRLETHSLSLVMTDLIVAPEHRGQGIGADLFATVQDWAHTRKAHRLLITAIAQNRAARRFYQSLGCHEAAVTFERTLTRSATTRTAASPQR